MNYKFQVSNEHTVDDWSSPIRIRTIVEKVPLKATVSFRYLSYYRHICIMESSTQLLARKKLSTRKILTLTSRLQ